MSLLLKKTLAVAMLSLAPMLAFADSQPAKANMNEAIRELQKMSYQDSGMRMVWWVPDEYWRLSSPSQAAADQVVKVLSNYTLIVVIDAKVSQFGSFSFAPEDEVRSKLMIFDDAGNSYHPLNNKDMNPDAQNILGFMRPIFANAMGDLGKNLAFVAFPRTGTNGKAIVDIHQPGMFHVRFGNEDFNYRLPLSAFSPKVKCADQPDLLPAYYKFCPFDGTPTVPANQ